MRELASADTEEGRSGDPTVAGEDRAAHCLVVADGNDDVIASVRVNRATYKAPKSVEFVDDLPETATGKVRKYELREEYREGEERMVRG